MLSDGTRVHDDGDLANLYANGRGVWVAFHAPRGPGDRSKVYGPDWHIYDAGLERNLDPVGPDGSVAYKVLYDSFGPWRVRHLDGSDGPTLEGDCHNVQNLGQDRVLWTEATVLRSNFGFDARSRRCHSFRFKDGHLIYQSAVTGHLVLDDKTIGDTGDYFRPDLRVLEGAIEVAWNTDEGEANVIRRTFTDAELITLPNEDHPVPARPPRVSLAYDPVRGVEPLDVHAEAIIFLESGDITRYDWLRWRGDERTSDSTSQPRYTYRGLRAGDHRIALHVVGPGGETQTQLERKVTVTPQEQPPDFHTWIDIELPQVAAAFETAQGHPPTDPVWYAFITRRRFARWIDGKEDWPLRRLIDNELAQAPGGGGDKPDPGRDDVVRLVPGGRFFLANGAPRRYRGVTAFKLMELFRRGENIEPFLDAFRGFNALRVFPYVPEVDWGAEAWAAPPVDVARDFINAVALKGFYTEVCLITDRHPDPVRYAAAWRDALQDLPGLLLEGVNEPAVGGKTDPQEIRAVLSAARCPYTSGDGEQTVGGSANVYGTYLTAHTPRDGEWPRKARNLREFYDGGGPHDPSEPAHRVPCLADEPYRPDQTGFDVRDHYTYHALASIMGAGSTFHFSSGKFGLVPTPDEAHCRDAALRGMTVFPADAPNGNYDKLVEGPDPAHEQTLRSYIIGNNLVRVRPKVLRPVRGDGVTPVEGWRSLDEYGVAFTRS